MVSAVGSDRNERSIRSPTLPAKAGPVAAGGAQHVRGFDLWSSHVAMALLCCLLENSLRETTHRMKS